MKYAYPVVGRCGLCNMMFRWAYAVKYCADTGAHMLAPQWSNLFRIGPWLRKERDKRYYFNEFTNAGYIKGLRRFLIAFNPLCEKQKFTNFPNFFDPILGCQSMIKDELDRIANPIIIDNLNKDCRESFIGMHIRRGDFVRGTNLFTNEWYIKAGHIALSLYGRDDAPMKIFSDAPAEEVDSVVRSFPNAKFVQSCSALQDLLHLSRSKVLVGTCNSTFSMWAVYLGQMPSIWGNRNHANGSKHRMYVKNNMYPIICDCD